MKKMLVLVFCLMSFGLMAQQDSTFVPVDTSALVLKKNRFEISKSGTQYTLKQFQDETTFISTTVTGKKDAVSRLSTILKQLNSDEAALIRELALIRERQKEIRAARNLYK